MNRVRRWWRNLFKRKPIALPGVYPWNAPAPLPAGTVLIDSRGPFKIVADGKGGVTTIHELTHAIAARRRASHRRTG